MLYIHTAGLKPSNPQREAVKNFFRNISYTIINNNEIHIFIPKFGQNLDFYS